LSHVRNIARDAPLVARFGAYWIRRRLLAQRKLPFVVVRGLESGYPLDLNAEQIPDRENAATLADSLDSDGQRRIRVNWRLMPQDVDSLAARFASCAIRLPDPAVANCSSMTNG
jgi:hypothetical protein